MEWNKFDKDTLTPYEKLGNAAKTFNGETKIFSYMAIRHVALLAYEAGVASQPAVEADAKGWCRECDTEIFTEDANFCQNCGIKF